MIIDPETLPPKNVYKLLAGAVVPRPIAWVSTISKQGVHNVAPYSFFTVASRMPPMLCFSIGPGVGEREGTVKDTLQNILDTNEFVINIVSLPLASAMHRSSENLQPEVDEFEVAGVTTAECVVVKAPRVKEAPISIECQLEKILSLGTDNLVIGRVVRYHIQDDVYMDGDKVNLEKLQPVGRLAGRYAYIEEFFSLPTDESTYLTNHSKLAAGQE